MRLQKISLLEVEALIRLAKKRRADAIDRDDRAVFAVRSDPIFRAACDLDPESLVEVIALMWLGRGAGGETAEDWPRLIQNAHGNDSVYLAEKFPLDTYLEDGLRKLGYKDSWRFNLD